MERIIFYIDNDEDDLEFVRSVAAEMNQTVYTFTSYEKMISSLLEHQYVPAIIFVDLNMPVKNGYEVIRDIKSSIQLRDIPLVIFSTANSSVLVKKYWQLGASLYVVKPISISALRETIKNVLDIDWERFYISPQNFLYSAS